MTAEAKFERLTPKEKWSKAGFVVSLDGKGGMSSRDNKATLLED
jgi:hypothetical protein